MKSLLTPVVTVLVLLMLPMLRSDPSKQVQEYYWMTTFTASLPEGLRSPGDHTFQYDFQYDFPEPGSLVGQLRRVTVSPQAPILPGYALLRPTGPQALVDGKNGQDCRQVKQISPGQPVKFMVTWIPDGKMSREEINEHIESMRVSVSVNGGEPVPMSAEQISISWDSLWNCRPWAFSTDLLEPAGQEYR